MISTCLLGRHGGVASAVAVAVQTSLLKAERPVDGVDGVGV
jgi:hypothetical protein